MKWGGKENRKKFQIFARVFEDDYGLVIKDARKSRSERAKKKKMQRRTREA